MNVLIVPNTKPGKGEAVNYTLSEILPFQVKCDFHPWMMANWLVLDHPYAAVTDKDGKFTIANLPTGDHEFRVWQERVGYVDRKYKVTVKPGDNELPKVELAIEKLTAKK